MLCSFVFLAYVLFCIVYLCFDTRYSDMKYKLKKLWKLATEITNSRDIFRTLSNMHDRALCDYTAWKVSKYGVFLVPIFLYSDWIHDNTEQKTLRIWTLFTQWKVFHLVNNNQIPFIISHFSLREKYPNTEFFCSVFSRIRTEYGEIWSIFPYSVGILENTDQKKLCIWTHFTQWLLHLLTWYGIVQFPPIMKKVSSVKLENLQKVFSYQNVMHEMF